MKETTSPKLESALNIDFSKEEENKLWLTNGTTLRTLIGILGMSLPLLLYILLLIDNGHGQPLHSISHYYYTRVSSIFVAIMSILGIFLIVYKGKLPIDFIISMIAGIFALFVVCFPTSNITDICCDTVNTYSVMKIDRSPFREGFHYASAGIFLGCLAYMSIFLFTKSNKPPKARGSKKILRNRIYRVCGALMIIAMAVMALAAMDVLPKTYLDDYHLTFWMETLAVESFGFSWLVKGETIFRD